MAQVVIENPVINSPFQEPTHHLRFDEDGITNDIVESCRVSSYFVLIAQPNIESLNGRCEPRSTRKPGAASTAP